MAHIEMIADVVERMAYIELVAGLWIHTRYLVGAPTAAEARIALGPFPPDARERTIAAMRRHGQVVA